MAGVKPAALRLARKMTYNSTMKFDPNIFKAYDIRGITPSELNPPVAHAIGQALADFLPAGQVAVGRDMRTDSSDLAEALIAGLARQDREVIDLSQVTSDMIYYAVGSMGLAGGAMITASHNPGQYDGIKLTGQGVVPIGIDSGLLTIEQEVEQDHYKKVAATGAVQQKDITEEWVKYAIKLSGNSFGPLKVGLDAGNGMAGMLVPYLQSLTPLQIDGLYLELDGTFPHHPANPLVEANTIDLRHLVQTKHLDCGLAFDGDGDRAFFCDETGTMLSGSVLGAILAKHFLTLHPGATILGNAAISNIVVDTVTQGGGQFVRTKVGHSYIKADMRRLSAVFACEHSGHFYFQDNYNADSGLIAVLTLLHILSTSGKTLSGLVAELHNPYVNSGEIDVAVSDKAVALGAVKHAFADGKMDELDGVTVRYPDWWFNLRPSNTEPLMRLNIEAKNRKTLEEKTAAVLATIKN